MPPDSDIVIYANHLLRSAYQAMKETAKTLLRDQRSLEADPLCTPVREIFKTVGFLDVKEKDQHDEQTTNTPVIIPAAGEDPVFKKILNGKPKAMLEIGGKTLLDHQIQTLSNANLADITLIAGYGKDKPACRGHPNSREPRLPEGVHAKFIDGCERKNDQWFYHVVLRHPNGGPYPQQAYRM